VGKQEVKMNKRKFEITIITTILIITFLSITAIGQTNAQNSNKKVDSIYVDLNEKKCKETIYSHVNSGFSCSGVGDYKLGYTTGSLNTISVRNTTSDDFGYSLRVMDILRQEHSGKNYVDDLNISFGKKAEFRFQRVNGKNKPFALIVRVNANAYKWDKAKKANIDVYKSSNLFVAKLMKNIICVTDVVESMPNQNVLARKLADVANSKPCLLRELTATYQASKFLVTPTSVGNVSLGMTVAEARRVLDTYTFSRKIIGYRDLGIVFKKGDVEIMYIDAGEGEDPDTGNGYPPIPLNSKIIGIEVLDSQFKTAKGVHPKMQLANAEKIYGKIKQINWDDEVGEFGEFTNQPKGYYFSLKSPIAKDTANGRSNSAGIYKRGDYQAKTYKPQSYIYSIAISQR
jgi:hypothetical protein